jgi:hypothetical protein
MELREKNLMRLRAECTQLEHEIKEITSVPQHDQINLQRLRRQHTRVREAISYILSQNCPNIIA